MSQKRKNPTGKSGVSSSSKPVSSAETDYSKLDTLSNTTESQRLRILKALRHEPITTLEARQLLSICSPAPRIMELRSMGHKIATVWRTDTDSTGQEHRVAQYVLLSEKGVKK